MRESYPSQALLEKSRREALGLRWPRKSARVQSDREEEARAGVRSCIAAMQSQRDSEQMREMDWSLAG